MAAIVGAELSGSVDWAGLQGALTQIGVALGALLWSRASDRIDRRGALPGAPLTGAFGALVSLIGVASGNFALVLVGLGGLTETESYGLKAYVCARDGTPMEPLADVPGVLRCSTCGHRTDASGEGVLGDGFDIVHRQWGLRGDPHAWSAMRDLVGATPTPPERDAIRAAYVDALRRVANVDFDRTDDAVVSREHLDHGGMSGGSLDLAWWRTKGIPLLVDRAADRRPPGKPSRGAAADSPTSGPHRGGKRLIGDVLTLAVVLAIPAATIGGGTFLLYQRVVGTRVDATVIGCDVSGGVFGRTSNYREDCVATWTLDGAIVVGGLSGGSGGWEPGETVDATVRGDTAYSRSLGLPILLIALGLPFLAILVFAARAKRLRGRPSLGSLPPTHRAPKSPPGGAA